MRPVNLIPPEQRRGATTPLRAGVAAYVVVGALAAVLGVVVLLVLTSNQISDHKAEKQRLQAEFDQAQARASALDPYTQFAALAQTRRQTVLTLAQSRFDWERVLRELSLVIPSDVWLTDVTGTVAPGVAVEGGTDASGREEVQGPALAIAGCGTGQTAVARFAADLRDIDGVTRVGVQESKLPEAGSAGSSGGGDCQTRQFIAKFTMLVAFDAVPVGGVAESATAPPETTAAAGTTSDSSATSDSSTTVDTTGSGG